MAKRWMVSFEAPDKPGIVAGLTAALAGAGGNLADVSMTRLNGVFVMLAVVITDDDVTLDDSFGEVTFPLHASASLHEIVDDDIAEHPLEGVRWSITVYGSDKPGIVAGVSAVLAQNGINIDDMSTRRLGEGADATYTMLIDATVPAAMDGTEMQSQLHDIAERLGVTCHATPVDIDTL